MSLWLADHPLVLASQSQVRRDVLTAAGLPIDVLPADIDERATTAAAGLPLAGGGPALMAREKSRAVAQLRPWQLVLGADQTLALGHEALHKPPDVVAAREQLKLMRGKTHILCAAIAVAQGTRIVFEHRG